MKVYVVCRGEYGEGDSPIAVHRYLENAIADALAQPFHGDPWEEMPRPESDVKEWRSSCDRVSVRTFEIRNQSIK